MFSKGQIVNYYYGNGAPASQISINRVHNNTATSMSGSFGGMGPFLMEFDLETGHGRGQYSGARIEAIDPPLF